MLTSQASPSVVTATTSVFTPFARVLATFTYLDLMVVEQSFKLPFLPKITLLGFEAPLAESVETTTYLIRMNILFVIALLDLTPLREQ